ncbi:MAG: 30S ribosomal protein S20 [Chlamydiae bacterium]|nr:30S ribosomal protein S20 [Chlamydiota bacterium]
MAEEKKQEKKKCPTAKKRDIQNEKQRIRNRAFKSRVKTAVRSFEKDITEKNAEGAKTGLSALYALLDKGVKKNIFKRNKVARLKSKFSSRIPS